MSMKLIYTSFSFVTFFISGCYLPLPWNVNNIPASTDEEIYIYTHDSTLYTIKNDAALEDITGASWKHYSKIISSDSGKIVLYRFKGFLIKDIPEQDTIVLRRTEISTAFIDRPSWYNTYYLTMGYANPIGLKFEAGYNINRSITLGIISSRGGPWSEPDKITLGITGKINFRVFDASFIYLSAAYGGTVATGEPDSYTNLFTGFRIPVLSWMQICPEAGFTYTSRFLSGGTTHWGDGSIRYLEDINDQRVWLGAVINLEINI